MYLVNCNLPTHMQPIKITLRHATAADAPQLADLHTKSWQLAYRGALSDEYLDQKAPVERLRVWTERFDKPNPKMLVTIAEGKAQELGFCCTFLDYSADGHMLDNLHVRPGLHRQGIGRQLMYNAAERVNEHDPRGVIFLWVLTSNTDAIRFYERLGGQSGRTQQITMAGNEVEAIMMSWPVEKLLGCL